MTSQADAALDHPTMDVTTDSPAEEPSAAPVSVDAAVEPTAPSEPKSDDDLDPGLLSDEQVDAFKGDIPQLRKSLLKDYTQKTQKVSAIRKKLEPYTALIESFEEDQVGTIEALARQVGLEVTRPNAKTVEEKDPVAEARELLAEALGPEYEDLTDRLAPVMTKLVSKESERATKPFVELQTKQVQEAAVREVNAELDRFGKTHPDWKTYEAEMNKLGAKVQPAADMDPQVYLEMLYLAVKKDNAIAEATGKVLTKMQRSVEGHGRDAGSVAADKVAVTPTGPPSWNEAVAAAKRGIRFE